jgi:hypothetical protein
MRPDTVKPWAWEKKKETIAKLKSNNFLHMIIYFTGTVKRALKIMPSAVSVLVN